MQILTKNTSEIHLNDDDKKASMGQTLLKLFKMQSQSESLKTKLCQIFAALICTQSQEIPKIKNEFKIALLDQINSLEIRHL